MSRPVKYLSLFLVILLAGGTARFIRPADRVMHTDESVNAHKLGVLIDTGKYRYDRDEYHGPVLYYLSFAVCKLGGYDSFASLRESILRLVPALFSLLTVVLLLLLRKSAGWNYTLTAGLLAALAPMLIFYGRYYIHETLLTFFSLLFIFSCHRYLADRRLMWVTVAGISAGLMHATKETFVINLAAAVVALVVTPERKALPAGALKISWQHPVLFLVTAAFTSVLLFSSFFSNLQGIPDSVTAYANYFQRAGQDGSHIHSWYYYLSLLAGPWKIDGFTATELWLLLTAAAGWVVLWVDRGRKKPVGILLVLGNYGVLLLVIYSAIPYKTPWNMLQFYPGLVILSACAVVRLYRAEWPAAIRGTLFLLVMAGGIHWVWTGLNLNFRYEEHPVNPYVYAHTSPDVLILHEELDSIARAHPEGYELPVDVVFPGHDYWPLPWYLRRFNNAAYYDSVAFNVPASPVVIFSPGVEDDMVRKIYELPPPGQRRLFVSLSDSPLELRPGVGLRAYVRKDTRDLYY